MIRAHTLADIRYATFSKRRADCTWTSCVVAIVVHQMQKMWEKPIWRIEPEMLWMAKQEIGIL